MPDPAPLIGENHNDIWQLITKKLKEKLPHQSYLTWFKPIEPISYDDNVLTLKVPSRFYYDWIEGHYSNHLEHAIAETFGEKIRLNYEIDNSPKLRKRRNNPYHNTESNVNLSPPTKDSSNLNLDYSFNNFITGDCNQFAYAAAVSLAESNGQSQFNPLLIYGDSGLGKTHLIQAIGNHIIEKKHAKRVIYVTSEQFTSDFVKGIQSKNTDYFKHIYRYVDVLLLDDVQFFLAKDRTQEAFFHTFNSLHQAGKKLIFSSDRQPTELKGFSERLISRLQWGLVAEIRPPDYETRLAILKYLSSENGIVLKDDIAHFIATHITDNVRSLRSALIQLLAQSSLIGKEINLDLSREAVKNLTNHTTDSISVEQIQEIVAREFQITSDLLLSKTKKKQIVHARQIAMFLTSEFTELTLKAIGLHFGGRDHATVIHARNSVTNSITKNPDKLEIVNNLRKKLELASF
ncbi:MAG: chromosomal replication initiator protein DnaA [Candidatus Hatepunaea meridiana]|nr:chromosomal replication initiator protein DnaA [Candidatus Hatepunaea meridiana]